MPNQEHQATIPAVADTVTDNIMTPAQKLQLEQLRNERAGHEAATAAAQIELHSLRQENTRILQTQAAARAFKESGVKFHLPQSDTFKLLKGQIEFDENHIATVSGVPLATALQELAVESPEIADGRSTKALRAGVEAEAAANHSASAVLSKADLLSVSAKVAFIQTHGEKAFSALPLRRPRIVPVKYYEDYAALPMKNRMELIASHGPDFAARLPRQPTESSENAKSGIKINRTKTRTW